MRIFAQNVCSCSVYIDKMCLSSIGKGLLLFVGFNESDDETVLEPMINKVINERVFQDDKGLTNLSLLDINGEIMSVSQFTLYADLRKGLRPSFTKAKKYQDAKILYEQFNKILNEKLRGRIKTGLFGADMKIELVNDGPFTILYDSEELKK